MKRVANLAFCFLFGSFTAFAQTPASNAGSAQAPSRPTASQKAQTGILRLDLTGQNESKNSGNSVGDSGGLNAVYVVPAFPNLDCPVSMRAEQGSGGGLRFTRNSQSPGLGAAQPEIAQKIHLSVDGRKETSRVVAARVTVHGTGDNWRMVPAGQMPDGFADSKSGEIKRSLEIIFHRDGSVDADSRNGDSADMVLSGFTSVRSITIDSLTYADGATWIPSAGKSCRVAPNPLMLVNAGH